MNIDFETEPIGVGKGGKAVFLRDIWPSSEEVAEVQIVFVLLYIYFENCWEMVTQEVS
jgi:aconitate hydratase